MHEPAVVDGQRAALGEPHRVQAEVRGGRPSSRRHEQLVGRDLAAVREVQEDPSPATADPVELRPQQQFHPRRPQTLRHQLTGEGLETVQHPLALDHHHHLRAQRGEGLRQFRTGHTASQHREAVGNGTGARRVAGGPGGDIGQPGDGRRDRLAAGAQDHRVARRHLTSLPTGDDLQFSLTHQPGPSAQDGEPDALRPLDLPPVVPVRGEGIPVGQDLGDVQPVPRGLTRSGDPTRRRQRLSGAEQRLAGHARPVGALPAQELRLHDGGAKTTGRRPSGGVLPDRPTADDHHVELVPARCHAQHLSPRQPGVARWASSSLAGPERPARSLSPARHAASGAGPSRSRRPRRPRERRGRPRTPRTR